jgi:hypothetical protein
VLRMEERWGSDARFRTGYGCGDDAVPPVLLAASGGAAEQPDLKRGKTETLLDGGDDAWLLGKAEPLLHMPAGEQTRSRSLSRRDYGAIYPIDV